MNITCCIEKIVTLPAIACIRSWTPVRKLQLNFSSGASIWLIFVMLNILILFIKKSILYNFFQRLFVLYEMSSLITDFYVSAFCYRMCQNTWILFFKVLFIIPFKYLYSKNEWAFKWLKICFRKQTGLFCRWLSVLPASAFRTSPVPRCPTPPPWTGQTFPTQFVKRQKKLFPLVIGETSFARTDNLRRAQKSFLFGKRLGTGNQEAATSQQWGHVIINRWPCLTLNGPPCR